jgi:hypothetical protein
VPSRLLKATPVAFLDSVCYFPWFGVPGCKGKDARAMLRLTNSAVIENRSRLFASEAWYENVRKNYGGK